MEGAFAPAVDQARVTASASLKRALLLYFALAAGVTAFTGDFRRVFVRFTMSAAVFLVGHAGACRVSAFLFISHIVHLLWSRLFTTFELGCEIRRRELVGKRADDARITGEL
jgi:hypothetical protein